MRSLGFIFALLLTGGALALGQPNRDPRDFGRAGAISVEELRREPITFELDIPYANTTNSRQRLDLYLPAKRKSEKLPVIVFVHGGGWQQGNKSDGARRLLPFVRTGEYAGVSLGYRLSGEATWPAQIHDSKAAIRWIRANAAKHALDADRIGLWGRSAGGHLVLMLGASGDVPELEGSLGPNTNVSSKVACVANFFGPSELLAMVGQPSDIDRTKSNVPEAKLIGGGLRENPGKAKAASPITYVTANDPPVLTVHGTDDRIVPYDQAVRLDAALKKAGVPAYFVTIDGGGHGDFGPAGNDRLRDFFDKYLRGERLEISTAKIQWRKP